MMKKNFQKIIGAAIVVDDGCKCFLGGRVYG